MGVNKVKVLQSDSKSNQKEMLAIYEAKFKALADELRLKIMYELNQREKVCVCDLTEMVGLSQSQLSYHLKILYDVNLINREKIGTWHFYSLNKKEVTSLLSEDLCCILYPKKC